ncbi:transcriptional regulator GutM [Phyllobacterium endophyticum]|uniref:transcriptional regulator GutM n=1 Tax=Phyllobacterium endophyticum TaxID=1149773 RepID=UPI0011CB0D6C|nr:transcriptional regulator GutM [Phyllobacterium endophyticum]TXR47688.1 transcriptional regulator [Phyllobacterium endophyticum]
MAMWQWGLLALGILWALQSLGVWYQMRHYSDVMKGITSKYNDGFVGAGNVRGRFGKGVIVLILVTPDLVVQRFLVMSGRSVFAKFKRREEFEGISLSALRTDPVMTGLGEPNIAKAAERAIEQIDKARAEPTRPGLIGIKPVNA